VLSNIKITHQSSTGFVLFGGKWSEWTFGRCPHRITPIPGPNAPKYDTVDARQEGGSGEGACLLSSYWFEGIIPGKILKTSVRICDICYIFLVKFMWSRNLSYIMAIMVTL